MEIIKVLNKLNDNSKDLLSNEILLNNFCNEIDLVTSFFKLNLKESILISVLSINYLNGEKINFVKAMRLLGFNSIEILKNSAYIKCYKTKGWIKCRRKMFSSNIIEYDFTKNFIDAILNNNEKLLERKKPKTLSEAIIEIRKLILNNSTDYDLDEFIDVTLIEINEYTNYGLIDKILNNNEIDEFEKLIIFWILFDFLEGKKSFDFDMVLNKIIQDPYYILNYKTKIKNCKSNLFKLEYFTFDYSDFGNLENIVLGKKLENLVNIEKIIPNYSGPKNIRNCKLIKYNKIDFKKLFFNEENLNNIEIINHVLDQKNYTKIIKQLTSNLVSSNLSIILYGLPGTGKTEYIKQLAKLTKRDIYQVDISNIKDLWVGNSEKNLKLIFNEYNQVLKTNKKTPILLFNEADAILGKRINVSSSVDQVFNSLQNILLQELEDFNGIFVATTNNITNIDNAFDRRFVFKIQLQLPNESTRYLILKENFPEINDDVVLKIARLYKLSGGQITNIKKRILLDTLVRKSSDKLDIYFEKYVIDETKFRKNNFEIGFKLN